MFSSVLSFRESFHSYSAMCFSLISSVLRLSSFLIHFDYWLSHCCPPDYLFIWVITQLFVMLWYMRILQRLNGVVMHDTKRRCKVLIAHKTNITNWRWAIPHQFNHGSCTQVSKRSEKSVYFTSYSQFYRGGRRRFYTAFFLNLGLVHKLIAQAQKNHLEGSNFACWYKQEQAVANFPCWVSVVTCGGLRGFSPPTTPHPICLSELCSYSESASFNSLNDPAWSQQSLKVDLNVIGVVG